MAGTRIWVKKQLRLDPLTFQQRDMVKIGSAGLLSVFRRLASAQGPNDGPAKPLARGYFRTLKDGSKRWVPGGYFNKKKRLGLPPIRNLYLTGQLLGSLKLRTVTDHSAYAAPDSRIRTEFRKGGKQFSANKNRMTNKQVGELNRRREPWLVFSPHNRKIVMEKMQEILFKVKDRIVKAVVVP